MSSGQAQPRADALRNRQRILEAARRLFEADGDAGPEAVAREAGVGVGTLYRHFATREALAFAVYEDELDQVAGAAPELLAALAPEDALAAWAGRFMQRLERKRQMGRAMMALVESGEVSTEDSRARLATSAQLILDAGIASGAFADGARGDDLVIGLLGIRLACPQPGQAEQAARLVRTLCAGLRAPCAHAVRRPPRADQREQRLTQPLRPT